MRKLSLILILCTLVICLISCNGSDSAPQTSVDGTNSSAEASGAANSVEATLNPNDQSKPTAESPAETQEPQVPQDKWTGRY